MADLDLSTLIGKHLIVGITYLDQNGQVENEVELHGDIIRVDEACLFIALPSGKEFSVPADARAFNPAPQGTYTFRSTKDIVVNPDYIASWTVHK